jgi:hypothetical protein
VSPEQKEWLDSQGKNLSQTMRNVISRAMPGGDLDIREVDLSVPPQIRFLEAVEVHYRFRKSCQVAQVSPAEITAALAADEVFREAYKSAQATFTEEMEFIVLDCAKGNRKIDKPAMTGLIAWLNNNHPAWGRVKAEMIQRIFGPLFRDIFAAAAELLDSKTYKKFVEKLESIREVRLLPFSD